MSSEFLDSLAGAGEPMVVGVVGCGTISHVYLRVIALAPNLRLKAFAGRNPVSTAEQAARYGGEAVTIEALLADPEIEVVLNLTPPAAHFEISRAVLEAGKHLYSEKPLGVSLEEADELMALASAKGLLIGCAPDTFLGRSHQAARAAIDAGLIGRVVGGAVTVASHGMEHWHPNPGFFYRKGGGPLLDVGPYPLTQLVNLLGPVSRVVAIGSRPEPTRRVSSQPLAGTEIPVEVETTVNGALLFESGANIALTASWDIWKHGRAPIELYGEEGSLLNPDPNLFTGLVSVSDKGGDWTPAPGQREDDAFDTQFARLGGPRGMGLVDLAAAVRERRAPRAGVDLAYHVLEVLLALEAAAVDGGGAAIRSRPARPEPLRFG